MRCRQCDHSLWGIGARQCPECGAPFNPIEHEFQAGAVRFCCPHCDQAYYGTGPEGHLEPPEFDCVKCGRRIDIGLMVLRPCEGATHHATRGERIPWLERKEIGRVNAWLATIIMSLVRPQRLISQVPVESSLAQASWFALVANAFFVLYALVPIAASIVAIPLLSIKSMRGARAEAWEVIATVAALVGTWYLLLLATLAIGVALWGATAHLLLVLSGGALHGPRRTYQAILYGSGAHACSGVPCVGIWFGWIWWAVSSVLMVQQGQRVGGVRAAVAVLTFPCLVVLVSAIGYGAFTIFALKTGQGFGPPRAGVASHVTDAKEVAGALRTWAAQHEGAGPDHALRLAAEDLVAPGAFIASGSDSSPTTVRFAGSTLRDFQQGASGRHKEMASAAAARLPEDVIAHRVGDFVFTYHSIDFTSGAPDLWIAVLCPDPEARKAKYEGSVVLMLLGGGEVHLPEAALDERLDAQNALRAAAGLAPLPDPKGVRHDEPARGAPSPQPAGPH